MMKRDTLLAEKRVARKMDYHPNLPFTHSVIDSHLEALDLIEGGRTATALMRELRLALVDLRGEVERLAQTAQDSMHPEYGERALFTLDLVAGMLTTDYRRYSTWADIKPQIEEEFSA